MCICGGATLYPYPLFSRADYERRVSDTWSCLTPPSSLASPARGVEGKAGGERVDGRPGQLQHDQVAEEQPEVAEGVPARALGNAREEAGAGGAAHVDERPVVCFCNAHNLL